MYAIQLLLFLLIAFVVLRIAARWRAHDMNIWAFVSWIVFWAAAAVVVWHPELSTDLAEKLGVGRGADLVIYISLIALFYMFFRLSIRFERQERNITTLTRVVALREGEKKQ